jgi:endonuclease/exonuclease/phosphatase (EEP) superfamily protein YafD
VLATSFVPFALVGYLVSGLVWLVARGLTVRRLRTVAGGLGVLSLVGVVAHAALLVPSYVGGHASGKADLTVLTANLRLGLGDTGEVTRIAERGDADVVVLEEVTPIALASLGDLEEALPYTAGAPFEGARGTMVFSRYPLRNLLQLKVFQGSWVMHVAAPTPFWLVAVHTSQPRGAIGLWRSDHRSVLWNTTLAALRGPVIAAGDFNATLDHRPMRDLMGLGLSDAARQANAGWQPTWPNEDHGRLDPFGRPVMAIDHVLATSQFSAVSTSTYDVPGSDHRALLARLATR